MVFLTTEDIFSRFFYSFPNSEPKPPVSIRPIMEKEFPVENDEDVAYTGTKTTSSCVGVEVQFAVAGFQEKDIKIWFEGRTLIVEGNNTSREKVAERFQCSFSRRISIKENLELEEATITLENGILAIRLPVRSNEKERTYLFGKKE